MKNQLPLWVSIVDFFFTPIVKFSYRPHHRPSTFALILHGWGRRTQEWVEERYCKVCYTKLENGRCCNCEP